MFLWCFSFTNGFLLPNCVFFFGILFLISSFWSAFLCIVIMPSPLIFYFPLASFYFFSSLIVLSFRFSDSSLFLSVLVCVFNFCAVFYSALSHLFARKRVLNFAPEVYATVQYHARDVFTTRSYNHHTNTHADSGINQMTMMSKILHGFIFFSSIVFFSALSIQLCRWWRQRQWQWRLLLRFYMRSCSSRVVKYVHNMNVIEK